MNARHKIILDRAVAKPAAFILNAIVRPVGVLVKRSHDDSPSRVQVIAVAKFLGMGSILRSTPLLAALRQKYPHATYIFITARKNQQLLEHIPGIDRVLYIRDTGVWPILRDTIGVIAALWRSRVDLYFDLEVYSAFAAIIPALGFARNRYGFYLGSVAFKRGLHTHLVYFNDDKNISRIYVELARACGIRNADYKIQPLILHEADLSELRAWRRDEKIEAGIPYLVINPNASDLLLERRWPVEYFAALIDMLALTWKGHIFIVGSSDERPYVEGLRNRLSVRARQAAYNAAGSLSLGAVMALLKESRLMITNDSGLYHIAASFSVKVISLWGPVDPAHYTDPSDCNGAVFYSQDIYCTPCLHKTDFPPCGGNNACMKSIEPVQVYKKACELLAIAQSAHTAALDAVYASARDPDLDITVRKLPLKP